MQIIQYEQLTLEQQQMMRVLERVVQSHDQTKRQIYLSNQYNANLSMPYAFLAAEDGQLIGFAVIYAEDDEVAEISLLVHPNYRQRGVATQLIQSVKVVCSQYQLTKIIFNTEKRFMQNNSEWAKKYYIDAGSVNEYLMEWQRQDMYSAEQGSRVDVSVATLTDCDSIAKGLAQAFESTEEIERRYALESIRDADTIQYVVKDLQQQIVGVCSVDCRIENLYYLFALCIFPKFQRKGYGREAVKQIIALLQEQDSKAKIKLAVEVDNEAAIHLYQQCGFKRIAELVALVEK
ncbi:MULTISPECIES: GNAT family N-acetyltransferase [unclassified Facklamia]|uniref:GNAT family N-acetyltransferase n=1 Tax=Aerococcaceae TaxID=186827 RepID=UPI0013D219AF|nr:MULTISPECIES: GNAT family N-acetyltransferase [unclassified Facklamia]QQD65348.1 GNAT family N-acetyltransferase [Aerococcaceae bacterium zg-252]